MTDFVANIFEVWGLAYFGPFSQYMYKADLYMETFLWLLLLPLAVLLIYYVVWDNIRFAKTLIWFAIVSVLSLIVAGIGYCSADAGLYDYLNEHHITNSKINDMDYIYFFFICFGWTFLWSVTLSIILKFFSVKGRYIPF